MTRRFVIGLLLVSAVGCMEGKKDKPLPRTPTLYNRLGGEPAITKVVDDFVVNMVMSKDIREPHKVHFVTGDVKALKRSLVNFVASKTGGPQAYTGRSMKDSHAAHGITNADFDATVAALVKALDSNGVGKQEKEELLAPLAAMRRDIVSQPDFRESK